MRRFGVLLLIGVLAVAACGASSSTAAQAAAPTGAGSPVVATAGGSDCGWRLYQSGKTQGQIRTFCGPARATIKIGVTTYNLTGGRCVFDPAVGFELDVGSRVEGASDLPADLSLYLGVISVPGSAAVATGLIGGNVVVITEGSGAESVKIAPDHGSGSFSGTALTDEPLTASFTC
jgi:hypothetical protein